MTEKTCHFCHQPMRWDESTTYYLAPGTIQLEIEVHSECLVKFRDERPAPETDLEAALREFADHPSWREGT